MSRLTSLTQEQVSSLDRTQLVNLLDELNLELVALGKIEDMIYRHRRTLDLIDNPSLAPSRQEDSLPSDSLLDRLKKAADEQGVDLTSLLQPFIK